MDKTDLSLLLTAGLALSLGLGPITAALIASFLAVSFHPAGQTTRAMSANVESTI